MRRVRELRAMLLANAVPDHPPRSLPRTRLLLSATLASEHLNVAIRLRDLSTRGSRIEGDRLPGVGALVQISRGTLQASGTIVWRGPKEGGLHFDAPLDLDQWMPGLAARDQLAVDAMVEAVRSGGGEVMASSAGPAPEPRAAPTLPTQRLAEELAYVARLLDSLGDDLCGEPYVVMRHAMKLQNLDIAAQILGHVAAVMVADHPEQAIGSIGMTNLRKRLQRTAL